MSIPARFDHSPAPGDFPVDDLLRELAPLRQIARLLDEASRELSHPDMADVETVDAPEQFQALLRWVNDEIDVRTLALRDYQQGINVTWPPAGQPRVDKRDVA